MRKVVSGIVLFSVFVSCIIPFSACLQSSWLSDAKKAFNTGRFTPELREILPEAYIDIDSLQISALSFMDNERLSIDNLAINLADPSIKTLPFSQLKGNYYDSDKKLVNSIYEMRTSMEKIKADVLAKFKDTNLLSQGVWYGEFKYEINEAGDMAIYNKYTYTPDTSTTKVSVFTKLSMASDGANEIYQSQQYADGSLVDCSYSYYKDAVFVYLCSNPDFSVYMSFDFEGETRNSTSIFSSYSPSGEIFYEVTNFSGNANQVVMHRLAENEMSSDNIIIDGISYGGSNFIDLRAFTNIKEIYYRDDLFNDNQNYVVGIKLSDNTIIDADNVWANFRMDKSMQFSEENGTIQLVPADGFFVSALLLFEHPSSIPSESVPFPQLILASNVDGIFADLLAISDAFFDDFYVPTINSLTGIRICLSNIETFKTAANEFLDSHLISFN
ncbi:MAG: hypothetical protein FWH42_01895 [Dehalococcoidia bacterium]|nr:hypothetical protein [Dehalococcoidia bacterium]